MKKREKFNNYIEELIIDQFEKDNISFDTDNGGNFIDDDFSNVVESIKKVVVKCVFEKRNLDMINKLHSGDIGFFILDENGNNKTKN